jgi:hypothetical protein
MLRGGQLASGRRHRRLRRLQALATIGVPMAASYLVPANKRITTYSIQWLKRLRPAWYREDLIALLELLRQGKIKPITMSESRWMRLPAPTSCSEAGR